MSIKTTYELSDNMKNELADAGLIIDRLNIVEVSGAYSPDAPDSKCEALLINEGGEHYLCGESADGTSVKKMTSEQANKWVDKNVEMPLM